MATDWRKGLRMTGWVHDEANDGIGEEVWKYQRGLGGEIKVTTGGVIEYMEGEVETLQRAAATIGQRVEFKESDPRKWVRIWPGLAG